MSLSVNIILATIAMLGTGQADLNRQEALCLTKAIFWEARHTNVDVLDQIRVANTVEFTARQRGTTICEEVERPSRYSWRNSGDPDVDALITDDVIEQQAWKDMAQIAVLKLSGEDFGMTDEPDHFYSPVTLRAQGLDAPSWAEGMSVISKNDNFVFLASYQ